MCLSLIKKNFVNLYFKLDDYNGNSSISCHPLGEINPETFSFDKLSPIIDALQICLSSNATWYSPAALFIAAKKVEGYVIRYPTENSQPSKSVPISPYIEDLNYGWIGKGDGKWTPERPTKCYMDVYEVKGGTQYFLTLGEIVGTRFRVIFSTVDVSKETSTVLGVPVNTSNYDNPVANQNLYYSPDSDGYLVVQKDNAGTSGIKTFLYLAPGSTIITEFDID